jgi:hypothetical protein
MGANNTKRGIAGIYKIKALYGGKEVASKDIYVKFDLEQIGTADYYYLRTHDTKHNNGDYHYSLSATNEAIRNAALQYYDQYGSDCDNCDPARKMVVNDQSLIWGGLFDIQNSVNGVNHNWDAPHISHRKGTSVDIPYKYYNGTLTSNDENHEVVSSWDEEGNYTDSYKKLYEVLNLYFTTCIDDDDAGHQDHFHCEK